VKPSFLTVVALAACLAACGPTEPPARLKWEVGRELVYEIKDRTVGRASLPT